MTLKPEAERIKRNIQSFKTYQFRLPERIKSMLLFQGLGFVTMHCPDAINRSESSRTMLVSFIREALI